MTTELKRKYAGGYVGGCFPVSGYVVNDGLFIESKNTITAEVNAITDLDLSVNLQKYNVSIFRHNEIILNYVYTWDKLITSNKHDYALVDSIATNILFQLTEKELDTLLPMIKDSTDHSFSMDYKSKTYYIHCQSERSHVDEFIISQFNNKFHFNECSLYRKNMSVHKIIQNYSDFTYSELFHSLSDDDKHLSFSGFHSVWLLVFDSQEMVINCYMKKKYLNATEDVEEMVTIQVKNIEDFYEQSFNMVFSHILSPDFIINKMSDLIEDYDLDPNQNWQDFVRLFDMATI